MGQILKETTTSRDYGDSPNAKRAKHARPAEKQGSRLPMTAAC
jgi:hypothetical protein